MEMISLFDCVKCYPKLCRCKCSHDIGLNKPCQPCQRVDRGPKKVHMKLCQTCCSTFHPVMLTTYLPTNDRCESCGLVVGELAAVMFEVKLQEVKP